MRCSLEGEGEWWRCQPLGWAYLFLPGLLACAGGGGGGGFSLVVAHFVVLARGKRVKTSFDVAREEGLGLADGAWEKRVETEKKRE